MFIGPWEQGGEWNDSGLSGISRWLNRVWKLVLEPYEMKAEAVDKLTSEKSHVELLRIIHQTIRKVTNDLEKMRFNTMIAALMEFTNYLAKAREAGHITDSAWTEALDTLLRLLAPTAPHLTEELWQRTGHDYSIHNQNWPQWDEALAKDEEITLVIQVNGKLRDRIIVSAAITEAEARQIALGRQRVKAYLEGKELIKMIYVPGRLVNLVVR
jgi:leucyl-tRNA synthetase